MRLNDTSLPELTPRCPHAPRLCPDRARPAYRFVPGLHPHPVEDPAGHSFGRADAPGVLLPPERWAECEDYLYGIDLYNEGYLWESHEAWEGLWKQAARTSRQARFLQGLIQNSAAQLKWHVGAHRGAASLSQSACSHLEAVQAEGGDRYMGVDVAALLDAMRAYYAPLCQPEKEGRSTAPPPCLLVG